MAKCSIPTYTITIAIIVAIIVPYVAATTYDVLIYGSTSSGVIAAVAAARHNLSVVLITPSTHVGGMTSSGLGHTDVGNASSIGGLALEFYTRIGAYYGYPKTPIFDFEPSAAEKVFEQMLSEQKSITILRQFYAVNVGLSTNAEPRMKIMSTTKSQAPDEPEAIDAGPRSITSISFIHLVSNSSIELSASVYIDSTYEGDLLPLAQAPFTYGRESRTTYNESLAGVTDDIFGSSGNNIDVQVDPWKKSNDSKSGLLFGVDTAKLPKVGDGDDLIQALNFRLCITRSTSNKRAFHPSSTYNADDFTLYYRFIDTAKITDIQTLFNMNELPHAKWDANNNGGCSSDMLGLYIANKYILTPPEKYLDRYAVQETVASWTLDLLYFLATDQRIPSELRASVNEFGYCADEFVDNNNFPWQLYVREGRRMIGEYTMTQADVDQDPLPNSGATPRFPDAIALGSYNMDSHNVQRVTFVRDDAWIVRNEGDVQVKPARGPYPISYGSLIPSADVISNLLVSVCVSSSHMGYASIRMEPVYMMLGHAAGVAAAATIHEHAAVQNINRTELQKVLREEGSKF